jgi:predicted transcriptional regulator
MVSMPAESILTTKWIRLILLLEKRGVLTYRQQKLYMSSRFFAVMREFKRLGWVEHTDGGYALTVEGELVVKLVFSLIV